MNINAGLCAKSTSISYEYIDTVDCFPKHQETIIIGYIRQEIQNTFNLLIPFNVKHLCYQYLVSKELQQIKQLETTLAQTKQEYIKHCKDIQIDTQQMNEMTEQIESELAPTKPALEAAQKAVSNINKKQLNEIKCLQRPPKLVDYTFRAVAIIIGKKIKGWSYGNYGIKKMLASNDFIPSLLKFDTNKLTRKHLKKIKKYYSQVDETKKYLRYLICGYVRKNIESEYDNIFISLDIKHLIILFCKHMCDSSLLIWNTDFNFRRVNKASRVAGPMVLWVKAQYQFAIILNAIEPMTQKVKCLKKMLQSKMEESEVMKERINEIEKRLQDYRMEHKVICNK